MNDNNNPDWVSNGKQTARKYFQEDQKIKRAHRLTSLHTLHRDGSVVIIKMIRTESQMENKLLENVSKKVEGPKEHTG